AIVNIDHKTPTARPPQRAAVVREVAAMHQKRLRLFVAAITVASVVPLVMSAADWKAPRTPWGDPDLQGVWSTAAEMSTPFERPANFGTRQRLTDAEFEERLKQVSNPGVFAGA